jgi:hypothetical protein
MEVAGHFGRDRLVGLVPKDDAADFAFLFDPPAAMVDESRVVVADDPDPVEPRVSERASSRAEAGSRRSRSGRGNCRRGNRAADAVRSTLVERLQRCQRIIGRQESGRAGEPAGLLEMQVGDQQRRFRRPVQAPSGLAKKS